MTDQRTGKDLGKLPTEQRNPNTEDIDALPTIDLVRRLNAEDATVAAAVERTLPAIAEAIDRITERIRSGGRLIYIGAGTSGRLGVLDASECPPTFKTPPGLVIGLIAGGDHALRHSIENIEDRTEEGAKALDEIGVSDQDAVVGIAASGRTPFVVGALTHAQTTGATTIALSNVENSAIARHADTEIAAVTGPEPITGSTRMKAGTAQKMVLNMLSTGTMIRLGKTFGNFMVDVQPSNHKLRDRAVRIVAAATETDRGEAADLLLRADNDVKTAILMGLLDIPADDARRKLESANGVIRDALATAG
ncbi:MAG TPA: N-acetylmuramic acid 6-phosphate etherase [Thermomicrobiales bacterium]|nr:N-acetylmuramic acid 6-phosphate etherase [Thermomicrobiales bacterium]